MDRYGKKIQKRMVGSNVLGKFIKEAEWINLWRIKNPNVRSYLWYAPGRGCMSQIDLALGDDKILPLVHLVTYMPRGGWGLATLG